MTFSILARDPDTGAFGGAAATGSLCVGGWVLRGDLRAGMSASQGVAPSTFWGEDVLQQMEAGLKASQAVRQVISRDNGREHRQLSALDLHGTTGAYTGSENRDTKGSIGFTDGIAAGNMLGGKEVLPAMVEAFSASDTSFAERLLGSLTAARDVGGDYRGLLSAALLVLHPEQPPLTLRIDIHEEDPIGALRQLFQKATTGEYAQWARQVPVFTDRHRAVD
ncbi:fimbrial assembly protein FimA [Chromatiales bacterium (ex Bugula neritina AB1)]|nr:fimbrial assembly protein FimA [Chromatiales bacterium (ex Bugula neritina AB1)]